MKLYVTDFSPYARIVRVVVHEKNLYDQLEIIHAQTRRKNSPYYKINPSGRVPYLIRDDGLAFEDTYLICDYLDQLDGEPVFGIPAGDQAWEVRRLQALASTVLEGIAVWGRELMRPENERSPAILEHEKSRNARMSDLWESVIDHPVMRGKLNMVQITLGCALGFDARIADLNWRPGHPRLSAWFSGIAARPSFVETRPPSLR